MRRLDAGGILLFLVACGGTAAVGIGAGDAGGKDSATAGQDAGPRDGSQDSTSTPDTTMSADTAAPDTITQADTGPFDTSSPEDTATPFDSGNPADTGTAFDSGHPQDSGNPFDSGHPQDSGNPFDSGTDAADDGGTCPSTPPLGMGVCSPEGLVCSYAVPEQICRCSHGAPPMVDATWHCSLLSPGCPPMQPTLGDTCSVPGLNCDYGMCLGGIDVVCTGGTWMQGMMFCPP